MSKSITTAILTIAAVTVSLMLVNALVPRMQSGSQAAATAAAQLESRVRTDLTIVHAAAESDGGGHRIRIWLKNTGSAAIAAINKMDVLVTNSSGVVYYPYGSGTGQWQAIILGADEGTWEPASTVQVTLTLAAAASGSHTLTFVTANGTEVKKTFSF